MDKDKKKLLRRKLGWVFIRLSILVHGFFPLGWSYFLGLTFGTLAYYLVARHRRVALEGLAVAFPNFSIGERKKIARRFFIFMAQSSFELLYFLKNPQEINRISIEGKEFLENALKGNRGIILVTAHMGNFPLMSVKLASEGYPVNFVTRPMRDAKTGDYLHNLRTQAGVKTILSYPRKDCVTGIMKTLRDNELVIMQMDQNFGTGGVWVKFFGKLAATPIGPITLALRTRAAIVPVYIARVGRARHVIRFFPKQELYITEDKDETVLFNAIKMTRIIEGWVRDYPWQWGWIHRRWKSRPSDKIEKLKFKIEKE